MEQKIINVAKDFSRFPSGRYVTDSRFSGEAFREKYLRPALTKYDQVIIEMDGTLGYGSSFLDEVFGGLYREGFFKKVGMYQKLKIHTKNVVLKNEIRSYLKYNV